MPLMMYRIAAFKKAKADLFCECFELADVMKGKHRASLTASHIISLQDVIGYSTLLINGESVGDPLAANRAE